MIVGGLSSDAHPAPASDRSTLVEFQDGARIGYDRLGHSLTALLPGGATVSIADDGGITLTGNVTLNADLKVSGKVTADGDVISGGKSFKSHIHTKVQPGSGVSGEPE